MRSSYRHKTMKRINICKAAGVCFEVLRDFGSLAADLDRLWKNAYDHASEYKREILPARFFERINAESENNPALFLPDSSVSRLDLPCCCMKRPPWNGCFAAWTMVVTAKIMYILI